MENKNEERNSLFVTNINEVMLDYRLHDKGGEEAGMHVN